MITSHRRLYDTILAPNAHRVSLSQSTSQNALVTFSTIATCLTYRIYDNRLETGTNSNGRFHIHFWVISFVLLHNGLYNVEDSTGSSQTRETFDFL